jgi:hypothetical protein
MIFIINDLIMYGRAALDAHKHRLTPGVLALVAHAFAAAADLSLGFRCQLAARATGIHTTMAFRA